MNRRYKSMFISIWVPLVVIGIIRAAYMLSSTANASEWGIVLLALLPPLAYFIWVARFNVARTVRATQLALGLTGIALISMFASSIRNPEAWFWVAGVGVLGTALYEWWFSNLGPRDKSALAIGNPLPALQFQRPDGSLLHTAQLRKPMLMIFYRGNWCPFCMAQVREIAGLYRQLADKGVEVMLISPQPHENTQALAQRFDVPMTFLVDQGNQMATRLGIEAANGLPAGLELRGYDSDTVMPTVLITDAQGIIIYADLPENYRLRPEPDAFLEVLKKAGI